MKRKLTNRLLSITSLAVLCYTQQLHAVTYYWDSNGTAAGFGTATGTWGVSNFWNTDSAGAAGTFVTATTSDDELRFGFSANYGNGVVSIDPAGVTANAISFRGGQTTGITLGNATNTITLGGTTPTLSNFNIHAVHNIAAALAGSVALTKTDAGLIALSGPNTYSGGTSVTGGTLVFRNLASKESTGTHAFGADSVLGLGIGDAGFFSTTDFENVRAGISTGDVSNITLDAATSVGIDTTSAGLTYTTAITGARGFAKLGGNTLTLGASNTYTGVTMLQGGTLSIPSLANAGSDSSIGSFATPGATGLLLRGGTLIYTGDSVSTDRGFTATGPASAITVSGTNVALSLGDSIYNNSAGQFTLTTGSGSSMVMSKLTSQTPNIDFTTSANANVTINEIVTTGAFNIAVRIGSDMVKVGNISNAAPANGSHWLSGLNISGSISGVTAGQNVLLGAGTPNGVMLTGLSSFDAIVNIQQGGVYTYNTIKNVGAGASAFGAPTTAARGRIEFGNGGNVPILRYIGTGDTTDRVLNLRGTTGVMTLEQAGTGLLKFTSNMVSTGASPKIFRLSGSTAGMGELAGAIVNNSATNMTTLEKTGTGTWILAGDNTYSGNTSINQGTLLINNTSGSGTGTGNVSVAAAATLGGTGTLNSNVTIAANGRLSFTLNAPSATHNSLELATGKTLTFSGDSVIDLSSSTATTPGTYTLVSGGENIVGSAPTVVLPEGWSANPPVISGNVLQITISSTGVSSAYASWMAANAPGSNVNDDADADGVSNGVEFILGGTAASKDASKLPTVTTTATNMVVSFLRAQSSIDPKTAVSVETSTDLVSWATSYSVSDSAVANNPGITVVKDSSPGFDTITLSIPHTPDDKKFARIRVVITP